MRFMIRIETIGQALGVMMIQVLIIILDNPYFLNYYIIDVCFELEVVYLLILYIKFSSFE